MSKRLKTVDDVKKLKSINGISISSLDALCRPLPDRTMDPVNWRKRSAAGFLTDDCPGLIETMVDDWHCVTEVLKTTHSDVADVLRYLWNRVERSGPEFVCEEKNKYHPDVNPIVKLKLQRQRFNAPQWSPFGSLPLKLNDESCCDDCSVNEHCWDEELRIKNEALGVELVVAEGVIGFIDEIGFFEGGDDNPYRVDPLLLAAVLTYTPDIVDCPSWLTEEAAHRVERIGQAKVKAIKRETELTVSEVLSHAGKDSMNSAQKWIREYEVYSKQKKDREWEQWSSVHSRLVECKKR